MRKFDFLMYAVALLFLWLLCIGLQGQSSYFKFYSATQILTLQNEESVAHFAHKLKQKSVVTNETLLKFLLATTGVDKNLRAGVYKLKSGSAYEVWQQLKNAKVKYYAVTFIPGKTLRENAKLNSLNLTKLKIALKDNKNFAVELQNKLSLIPEARAAFLLPETYFLDTKTDFETSVVRSASRLWVKRVGKNFLSNTDKEQLLNFAIVASIVEGEARIKEDRPVLAAIFFKRLALPMRLQSCATIMYCWKEERGIKKQRLTYEDLKIKSAFNTYAHDGLPPAPINMPSESSWNAVLQKKSTDYLYFFADGRGKHIFSKTYAEHLQKQKELLK